MKLGAFLILIAATFYAAGMFRSIPLLILFLTECLLIPVMYILLFFFRKNISFELANHKGTVEKGAAYWCEGKITGRGKLPVSRLRFRVCFGYAAEAKVRTRYLYGGAVNGETHVSFGIHPSFCGLIKVSIKKLRVYDYLSLFSLSKALDQEFELAVFPTERLFPVESAGIQDGDQKVNPELLLSKAGESYGEIRQIREYQSGDHFKSIHWNQSARLGGLWVREYEKETDPVVELLLEIGGKKKVKTAEADVFYELLSGLVLGILAQEKMLRVYWYNGSTGEMDSADVRERMHCRELLYRLYKTDLFREGDENGAAKLTGFRKTHENLLRLTDGLCVYRGDTLIRSFTAEDLCSGFSSGFKILRAKSWG